MRGLLIFREHVKKIYTSADIYILPALRFVLAFWIFSQINSRFGYFEMFDNIFIVLVFSIICALLPLNGTIVIGMIMIVLNCFALGMEVGLFALALYLLLLILVLRFVSRESFAVLIAPFSFIYYCSAAVAVSLGLTKRVVSAVTGVCAVISVYFLKMLPGIAALKGHDDLSGIELLRKMLNDLLGNQEMILYIIVFVAVILVVHMLHTMLTKYGWSISIIAGCGTYFALTLLGSVLLKLRIDVPALLINVLISAGICFVISFFLYSVDYKGSRRLQFEDDDYYYYVTAIPKNSLIKNRKRRSPAKDEF